MSGLALVKVTGKCPYCDVRKHQIDTAQERAMQIVGDAIEAHIREAHPAEWAEVDGVGGAR